MFDSIIFRRHRKLDLNNVIDIDALFEAMLFYQSVTIIADQSMLKQLITKCGHDFISELISNKFLKIEYLKNNTGIRTQNTGTWKELHDPVFITSPVLDLDNVAVKIFQEITGKAGKGRRMATRFLQNITEITFDDSILNELSRDLADSGYVEESVRRILESYAPEYPNIGNVKYLVTRNQDSLTVDTNINFHLLNDIYHKRIPISHSTMSSAYILSHLLDTRSDIHFASSHSAEIATDPISSAVMGIKFADLLERRGTSLSTMHSFQDFVNIDTKRIGAALSKGDRSYSDFLSLLEKAKKMRNWLADKEPDVDLIKAYHEAVVADSWADKLPAKATRWSIFSGIGLGLDALSGGGLGTMLGLGISAADSFLLDKLIRGWKPNHFIAQLENFLESQ